MNDLQVFKNAEFGEIRTVTINDEPWFVGKDVAKALGYERATKAIQDHVEEEDRDGIPIRDSIGRMQNTPIINESGLYSLILSSKLPTAKKFKHWVTSEVLPSIRKDGKSMNEIILSEENGQVLVSSREVAEKFGKAHDKVKRSIKSFEKDVSIFGEMFILSYYDDSYGRKQEEYLMTRDGFSLLCMGFTGKKALEWKLKFIEAFNQMENRLKNGNQITEEERLKLQLFSKDEREVAYAHNRLIELATAPLIAENKEMKPKAVFADAVKTSHTSILVGDLAKILKQNGIEIGPKRLFEWLRNNGYLIKRNGTDRNMPTQKAMEMGLFEVKESTINNPDGSIRITKTTKVTGKGQLYFINKFLGERSNSDD